LKFDMLIVFLDISDIFDEAAFYYIDKDGRVRSRDGQIGRYKITGKNITKFLRYNTIASYLIMKNIDKMRKSRDDKKGVTHKKTAWLYGQKVYEAVGKPGLEKAAFYMDKLRILLTENGIDMAVIIYPWAEMILKDDFNYRYVSFWDQWCEENKVDFVNTIPDFTQGSHKEKKDMIKRCYINNDVHFSAEGHRFMADLILKSNVWKPEESL